MPYICIQSREATQKAWGYRSPLHQTTSYTLHVYYVCMCIYGTCIKVYVRCICVNGIIRRSVELIHRQVKITTRTDSFGSEVYPAIKNKWDKTKDMRFLVSSLFRQPFIDVCMYVHVLDMHTCTLYYLCIVCVYVCLYNVCMLCCEFLCICM